MAVFSLSNPFNVTHWAKTCVRQNYPRLVQNSKRSLSHVIMSVLETQFKVLNLSNKTVKELLLSDLLDSAHDNSLKTTYLQFNSHAKLWANVCHAVSRDMLVLSVSPVSAPIFFTPVYTDGYPSLMKLSWVLCSPHSTSCRFRRGIRGFDAMLEVWGRGRGWT